MIVLSNKALRFIESGVSLLPDQSERTAWTDWAHNHQDGSDQPHVLPARVLAVALAAIETKVQDIKSQRASASEDDAFYFDNDLSYVRSIETALIKSASHPN